MFRLLKPLEIDAPPFKSRPRTNERPHWAKPSLVAQLKFTEWTDEGFLRHPIYLGMRDDVKAQTVRREKKPTMHPDAARGKRQGARGKSQSNELQRVID